MDFSNKKINPESCRSNFIEEFTGFSISDRPKLGVNTIIVIKKNKNYKQRTYVVANHECGNSLKIKNYLIF